MTLPECLGPYHVINRKRRKKAETELLNLNISLEKLVNEGTRELQVAKERLEVLNKQLDLTSRIDALTGLYNRHHMEERLNEEYQAFLRTERVFSIMLMDIDDFKQINDQYGHDAGDAVLKKLSNMIREIVRDYDVVARWGGEEFLLLFPGLSKDDTAERAERSTLCITRSCCTSFYGYDPYSGGNTGFV